MPTLNVKGFPVGLYRRLQLRAKREHRSVAQEVVHLLSEAVEEPPRRSLLDLEGLGKEIWREVDAARYVEEERSRWGSSKT